MKEICALTECQRVHYNTVRAHSALGYRPPGPATWLTEIPRWHENGKYKMLRTFPHLRLRLSRQSDNALHEQSTDKEDRAAQGRGIDAPSPRTIQPTGRGMVWCAVQNAPRHSKPAAVRITASSLQSAVPSRPDRSRCAKPAKRHHAELAVRYRTPIWRGHGDARFQRCPEYPV